ncbi:MAG: response regulator [SAR324 cluster bacterium]|nr:response regulator [SAR324 cluster bacterium]
MMSTYKILSVEDEDPLRKALAILLEGKGFEVAAAANGQEALDQLADGLTPDILLVDNNMPIMNGIGLIQHLKNDPRYVNLPVVFLSAINESQNIIKALQCGAIDYITKPYDPEDLFQRINRAFEIGKNLQLSQTLQQQYNNLQIHWEQLATLPYMEFHLSKVKEVEPIAHFFAANFLTNMQSQITIGLIEALTNSVIHGNYEISSELREQKEGYALMQHEIEQRQETAPYKNRKVVIVRKLESQHVEFHISDEGNGFDITQIADPRVPENVGKTTGRGILMMQIYFDEVKYNSKGNAVILYKTL